jgi:hypothetical protein
MIAMKGCTNPRWVVLRHAAHVAPDGRNSAGHCGEAGAESDQRGQPAARRYAARVSVGRTSM